MKTKQAISSPSLETITSILSKHMDQTAVNQVVDTAETLVAAIDECLCMIRSKAQTETSVHFLSQYRDQVKVLLDQKCDLQAAIADNNQQLEALRDEINKLIG